MLRAGVDKKALIAALWPHTIVEENNLTQVISVLRRAVGTEHVVTLAGRGYQFVAPVRVVRSEADGVAMREAGQPSRMPPAAEDAGGDLPIAVTEALTRRSGPTSGTASPLPPLAKAAEGRAAEVPAHSVAASPRARGFARAYAASISSRMICACGSAGRVTARCDRSE